MVLQAPVAHQEELTQAQGNANTGDRSLTTVATAGIHSLPPGGSTSARNTKVTAKERENEETLTQLQIEYNALLRRHAEAENTIDELRLGAKVNLYSDSPTPQQGQMGSLAAPHHAQTLSIARMGAGSLTVPSGSHGYISSAVSEYILCVSFISMSCTAFHMFNNSLFIETIILPLDMSNVL